MIKVITLCVVALPLSLCDTAPHRGNNIRGQLDASCKNFNAFNAHFGDICHNLDTHWDQPGGQTSGEWCANHGNAKILGDSFANMGNNANARCCACGGGDRFSDDLIRTPGIVQLPGYDVEIAERFDFFWVVALGRVKDGSCADLKMDDVYLGAVETVSRHPGRNTAPVDFKFRLKLSGVSATCKATMELDELKSCSHLPWEGGRCDEDEALYNARVTVDVQLKDGLLDVWVKGVAKVEDGRIKIDGRLTADSCKSSINVYPVRITETTTGRRTFDWMEDLVTSEAQRAEDDGDVKREVCGFLEDAVENTDEIKKFLEGFVSSQSIY